VILIAGSSKQQSLLMAGDDDKLFMTGSLNIKPKTTEQHLIVCSGKSEAEVSNNRQVPSRYCTIKANY